MKARARAAAPAVRAPSAPAVAFPPSGPAWRHPGWAAALLALVLGLPTLGGGFVWDDLRLVSGNAMLRSWSGLGRALTSEFWAATGSEAGGLWRPLVTLSYAVDRVLFRGQAWGSHLVNVLAAAAVAGLLTALAVRGGARRPAALLAGLWFAAMPHHVESVAWVSGRTDVLAALFLLLALWLDRRADERDSRWPGAAALLALGAALLAKESCAAFAAIACVAHAVRRPARPWTASLRWAAPYALVTVAWLLAHRALVASPAPPAWLSAPTLEAGRRAAWLMPAGFLQFLWPFATHTPATLLRLPDSYADRGVIAGLALQAFAVVTLAVLTLRRSRFATPLWLAWASALPVFAVALTQAYPVYSERLMYLPSAGLAWAAGLALTPAMRRAVARNLVLAAGAAWVLACAWITWRLDADWRSEESLYTSMTARGPQNAQGWLLLARLRLSQNRPDEARAALAAVPGAAGERPEVHSLRALIAFRAGDWASTLHEAETALQMDPALTEPRLSRAAALLRLGRTAAASEAVAGLLHDLPDSPAVASLEGQRLLAMQRPGEALPWLRRARSAIPDDADLAYALGMSCALTRQVPAARDAFAAAVRIDPAFYEGWLRLATAQHLLGAAAARDSALARAGALPDAADGRVEALRARFTAPAAARTHRSP